MSYIAGQGTSYFIAILSLSIFAKHLLCHLLPEGTYVLQQENEKVPVSHKGRFVKQVHLTAGHHYCLTIHSIIKPWEAANIGDVTVTQYCIDG